jgi:hypothetical protein
MKIRFLLALVGLAIGFAAPALAQLKDTVDPKTAQEIRALAMKYDAAFNNNDAAAVAALYTEDAVLSGPHGKNFIDTGRQCDGFGSAANARLFSPRSDEFQLWQNADFIVFSLR